MTPREEIAQMLRTMPTDWHRQYRSGRAQLGVALPDVPTPEQAMMLIGITAGGRESGDSPTGKNRVPRDVKEAAMKGLRLSHRNNYGAWNFIGIARAIELVLMPAVSDTSTSRMHNYLFRHAKDKAGKNFGNDATPSRGYMAWLNWGGDPAVRWLDVPLPRSNPDDDYWMAHRPPEDGPLAHELGKGDYVPADILKHPEWYTGFPQYLPSFWRGLRAAQGQKGATLRIYRALPKGHDTFRRGDWVTLSLAYAREHLERGDEPSHIIAADVAVSDVRFAGDDLMEWGYWGPTLKGATTRSNPKTYLFSYGSNSPRQLAERLGRSVRGEGAYAPGMVRAFRGQSRTWGGGGVATLLCEAGGKTFGYITEVTPADLALLDRYEGAPRNYKRTKVDVVTEEGRKVKAIAYLATSTQQNAPTREYLQAVAETIGTFWSSPNGSDVTWRDIKVR
jgi:cation transport regulator ChaC